MIDALVRLILGCAEERLALAELHRANARRALEAPVSTAPPIDISSAPLTAPTKAFACPDRWAECVFANLQDTEDSPVDHARVVKLFTCETHGIEAGTSCPEEEVKQAPKPVIEPDEAMPSIKPVAEEGVIEISSAPLWAKPAVKPFACAYRCGEYDALTTTADYAKIVGSFDCKLHNVKANVSCPNVEEAQAAE